MIFYICFDDKTGAIQKVTNEPDNIFQNLQIDKATYVKFINGTFSINDYLIVIQPRNKEKYKIVKKEIHNTNEFINYSIHPFEKINETKEQNVFYIIQDNLENSWKVVAKLEDDYKTFLINSKNYTGYDKHFYITEEGNPNKLLKKLTVAIDSFFDNKEFTICQIDNILKGKKLSLYAYVTHEKYMHVIRN
jgi:hypothetical protein